MEEVQPVVQCCHCGFIYCNPIPVEEELFAYYDESYVDWDNWERTFRHDRQWVFYEGLKRIQRLRPRGKLLDVGCSLGIFLEAARGAGYDCHGVEVSRPAAGFAQERLKLKVFHGTLEAARFGSEFFDVITLWDVLEHVSDPSALMQEVHRILKPGGLLVVRVPNVDFHLWRSRIVSRFIPSKDIGLDTVNHLNHYSARCLRRFLTRNGFVHLRVLPGAPNIYDRPVVDGAKHLYHAVAKAVHALCHVEIATIIEAYGFRDA